MKPKPKKPNPNRDIGVPKLIVAGLVGAAIGATTAVWLTNGGVNSSVVKSAPPPGTQVAPGTFASPTTVPIEKGDNRMFPPRSDLAVGTERAPGGEATPVAGGGMLGTPSNGGQMLGEPPSSTDKIGTEPPSTKSMLGTPVPPGTPGPGSPRR